MTPLKELLSRRDAVSAAELMLQLKEGLSRAPANSREGAATHQLMLDYFRLDERASKASFASAFKKYPQTAQALQDLARTQGLNELAALMQSVMTARARPTGTFKQGLQEQVTSLKDMPGKAGVMAALKGFASVAFASDDSEADMELSLAWGAVEDCLLDELARHEDVIDFQWGPIESRKRQDEQDIQRALAGQTAVQMLQAFFADPAPTVIARATDWDIEHEGASPADVTVAVHHVQMNEHLPAKTLAQLSDAPAAAQLLAVYRVVNGAALFCTDPSDSWSAGFLLLPVSAWGEASAEVIQWLTAVDFQDDISALPQWVRTAIAFGKIPGDASYWLLPVEGSFAGRVLLSNDDVSAETSRFDSFDSFVATLRLHTEKILGSGGYISYPTQDGKFNQYPTAYRSE